MKSRTFIVLITEDYEDRDLSDDEAITELAKGLQAAYDEGIYAGLGGNFLITHVEDGNEMFWQEWKAFQR